MVGYFLDYYGNNALEHLGWMVTVSRALPLLYVHNLNHYVEDLFYKECFADKDLDNNYAIDDLLSNEKIAEFQQSEFKAFKANTKLKQINIKHVFTLKQFLADCSNRCLNFLKELVDNDNKEIKPPPIILRVVPLPNFTVNDLPTQKLQELIDDIKNLNRSDFLMFLVNVFKHIFVPRGYRVSGENLGESNPLSPLTRVVKLDQDVSIFDNPAMEAIIDFKWMPTWIHFSHSFILFTLYAAVYSYLCYAYTIQLSVESSHNFLLPLIVYFYYAAYYLFSIELKQLRHYGFKDYLLDIYNIFDLITLFTPVILMTVCLITNFELQDGFGDINVIEPNLVILMSFSVLLIWCEFVSRSIYLEGGGVDEKTK